MRLVRFEDPIDGIALEFHPLVTVVGGLSDGVRERLMRAARALPRAGDPGAGGSIEVHGVLLDLERENLELLELHEDLDVVINALDLPGAGDPLEPTPSFASVDARPTASAELGAARERVSSALAALDEARAVGQRTTETQERIATRLRAFEAQIEAAQVALDAGAQDGVDRARAAVAEIEQRVAAEARAQLVELREAAEERLAALLEQSDALRSEVERLRALDPRPVRDALERCLRAEPAPMVPSHDALRLADELAAVIEQLALSEGRAAGGRSQLVELTARRDAAYDAFVETEQKLRTPQLDRGTVERLETVHDEIFELDVKGSRLSGARTRRRILELKEEEDALLAELGYDTWTNYVMGVSSEDAEAERMRRFEVAKATYEFAEDELAKAAMTPKSDDLDLAGLERRYEELLIQATELLGVAPQGDPTPALRALLVPAPREGDPLAQAVDALRAVLEQSGVTVEATDPHTVQRVATRHLEDVETAATYLIELEADLGRIDGELTDVRAEVESLTQRERTVGSESAELSAARQRLDEAEARLGRHQRASESLTMLESEATSLQEKATEVAAALGVAKRNYEAAKAELEAARAEADDQERRDAENARSAREQQADDDAAGPGARSAVSAASARSARARREARERDRGQLEWYVLARMAQQRSLSFVGSVPLILDDAFANWPHEDLGGVLERLQRMSDVIQVIVLSDDVDLLRWARDLGRDRAGVLDFATV